MISAIVYVRRRAVRFLYNLLDPHFRHISVLFVHFFFFAFALFSSSFSFFFIQSSVYDRKILHTSIDMKNVNRFFRDGLQLFSLLSSLSRRRKYPAAYLKIFVNRLSVIAAYLRDE